MRRSTLAPILLSLTLAAAIEHSTQAGDWTRFRGPNGAGVADGKAPPTEWSETKNLKWKVALPGPGLSSPIVVGDKVLVTCWSGYAAGEDSSNDQKDLRRHLVCVDRKTGSVLWTSTVEPVLPEDDYRGMFRECGYAAHTPVSDGERVYAFFGKSGIVAYDLEGKQLWQKFVGKDFGAMNWGTASSPILYKNLVIVPATAESDSLVAFDKVSGEQVWQAKGNGGFSATWGSPVLVNLPDGQTDLVVAVPFEIWGFNPDTGKLRWYCAINEENSACASPIVNGDTVYFVDGMRGSTVAVRAGGKDDVSKTHLVWSGSGGGRISTPVYHDGRLYVIARGSATCLDAATGDRVYQSRIDRVSAPAGEERPAPTERAQGGQGGRPRGGFGGGGFGSGRGFGGGGFGGGMGGQDYSSPVAAGDKLYYVFRSGEAVVLELGTDFRQVATNRLDAQGADFSATPAISDGELFIRSSKYLYCIGEGE